MKKISIVIVTYNSDLFIQQCLDSLLSQSFFRSDSEIIIIDNNSSDGTKKILHSFQNKPGLNIIFNKKNLGYTKACNQGIKISEGKYALLLNPDTQMFDESFERIIHYMESHPDTAVAGPKLFYADKSLQYSCRTFPTPITFIMRALHIGSNSRIMKRHLMQDFDHKKPFEVDWLLGSCMLIRKDSLKKVGLLDEKYFLYYSDIDFCWRVWKAGLKVVYVPETEVIHLYQRQSAKNTLINRLSWSHLKSAIRFFRKKYFSFS
jgi:GT2 family glycosyltransferase